MILSIIIPVFNSESFVEKCIKSCVSQDLPSTEYEIICVNDGSTDNSLVILKRLASEYHNISIVCQQNGGLSSARNTGMLNAKGDYYMFVDSDDWIANNCLGKLANKLRTESPDALAICAATMYGDHPQRRFSYDDETPISGKELLTKGFQHCAPFALWRASFFKMYGLKFYEGIFHEDSELTPRAYYLANKVSFCNDLIYFVYQNPNSITRTVNPKKSFDLINVVCPNLSDFVNQVEREYRFVFYNTISTLFNNSMFFILSSHKQQDLLNKEISMHMELYDNLCKSTKMKYRFEGMLLKLFPKYPLKIYKLLHYFC